MAMRAAERPEGDRLQRLWAICLAVNLPFPLLFGVLFVAGSPIANFLDGVVAMIGMFSAIGVLWLAGHCLCGKATAVSRALVTGGWVVAASQTFPVPQYLAGLVGLVAIGEAQMVENLFDINFTGIATFAATAMTGIILSSVAMFFGFFIEWRSACPRAV